MNEDELATACEVTCDDIASDADLCDLYDECPACGAKLIDGVMVHASVH